MPDYSKGKIYRLTCDDSNLIYYGSTTLELRDRFKGHKNSRQCSSKKLFEVGGVEIELVLECPCDTLKELREVEQTYICNDICINEQNAYFNRDEYEKTEDRINRKKKYETSEKRKQYKKEYRLDNKETIKQYNKEYRLKQKLKTI
jgi:hypothetical protein